MPVVSAKSKFKEGSRLRFGGDMPIQELSAVNSKANKFAVMNDCREFPRCFIYKIYFR